jgi:hypothetical protein
MNHVEQRHVKSPGYACPLCHVHVPTYQALHKHTSRNHKRRMMSGVAELDNENGPLGLQYEKDST